jgi:hypothetical protein
MCVFGKVAYAAENLLYTGGMVTSLVLIHRLLKKSQPSSETSVIYNNLHSITSKEEILLAPIAIRISNLTYFLQLYYVSHAFKIRNSSVWTLCINKNFSPLPEKNPGPSSP